MNATHIEVSAAVRYWEDAEVNGVEDTEDGALIPCKVDPAWCPVIRLADGVIEGWPVGTRADVHYKVCDQGEYWLRDADGNRIARWNGHYVPDDFLCHGDRGYGDYIIMKIDGGGMIEKWRTPVIHESEWQLVARAGGV